MRDLPAHKLSIALLQPQIAPNTGNIARLCVATGTALHLVRPLGFVLSDKNLKRSAMDYWPRLRCTIHDTTDAFFDEMRHHNIWLCSSKGQRDLWDAKFLDDDVLVLGSETKGIDETLLAQNPRTVLRIPQAAGERCLNLATAAGIVLFEALRQITR